MSLQTPFGPLNDIPLDDIGNLEQILVNSDKSRLLEGLVVEAIFNEYLSKLSGQGMNVLPISVVRTLTFKNVANADQPERVNSWWLWDYSGRCKAADRLRNLLEPHRNRPGFRFDVSFDESERDFFIDEWDGKKNIRMQPFFQKYRDKADLEFLIPAQSVIDENRSKQAFWSGISSCYDAEGFKNVVLQRLFKNCALQPFFDGVWDIDSLAELADGSFMQLEVKHKYPHDGIPGKTLAFGINDGQLWTISDLARRGIPTLHMILVKPRWNSNLGSGYLLNRVGDRKNVLLIAKLIDRAALDALWASPSYPTGRAQSLDGNKEQRARYLNASEFQLLGTFDDPVDQVAQNIRLAASGILNRPVTDQLLQANRIHQ